MGTLPQLAAIMYLLAGALRLVGVNFRSSARASASATYLALGGFWLGVYYFGATHGAGWLREHGRFWPGLVLLLAINYLALDFLYGWVVSRSVFRKRSTSMSLLGGRREPRQEPVEADDAAAGPDATS